MKIKINLLAIIFYIFIIIFSTGIFYSLSKGWYFPYNIILTILPTLFVFLWIYVLIKIPLEKLIIYINNHKFIKLIFFIFLNSILFIIFYFYNVPEYYYIVFFVLSIIFLMSNYLMLYGFSIVLFLGIFLIFQFFYLQNEFLLSYVEYIERIKIQKEILKELDISKTKEKITIKNRTNNSMISFKIPDNFTEIQEKVIDFPLIYIGKPEKLELPIFSCFIVKKNYPMYLFELRVESFLTDLKKLERIDNYQKIKNPFLQSILKEKVLYNQFYSFYDRFYAANIHLGFYAVDFDPYLLIFWVREIPKTGFPHDPQILEIFNSINR